MINPNGQTTLMAIDSAGNFHRLDMTVRPLGPRSDLLLAAAANEGTVVQNITKIGELPVTLFAAKSPSVAVILPFLRIRTYYRAVGAGKNVHIVPWFQPENCIDFTCEWQPPQNCQLVFIMQGITCYLIAVHASADGKITLRRIPLPNIYGDGRVCMGDWNADRNLTMVERFNSAITHFATSAWNADMLTDEMRQGVGNYMRFSIEGKQLPAISEWDNYAPMISGAAYNWIAGYITPKPFVSAPSNEGPVVLEGQGVRL